MRGAFEYQGQKCSAASRAYVPHSVWDRMRRRFPAEVGELQLRRRHRPRQLRWRRHRPAGVRQERRRDRTRPRRERDRHPGGRQVRRQRGVLRRTDRAAVRRPTRRVVRHRVLRAGPVALRLRRLRTDRLRRHPRRGRRDGALCAHRRGDRAGPRGDRRGAGGTAVRGGELLRQRQAHRGRRRAATVRRGPRLGHQRQGGLAAEPAALGVAAHDQGDVRAADRRTATRTWTQSRGRAKRRGKFDRRTRCARRSSPRHGRRGWSARSRTRPAPARSCSGSLPGRRGPRRWRWCPRLLDRRPGASVSTSSARTPPTVPPRTPPWTNTSR